MSQSCLIRKWTASDYLMLGKIIISELFFEVPKDYSQPDGRKLRLFARSVERSRNPVDLSKAEPMQAPWCM
jgi:hypothetical protein